MEAAKLEMERVEGMPTSERAAYKPEKRMKLEFAKLEAERDLCLAQAERTKREMDLVRYESERSECVKELQEHQGKVANIKGLLAKSCEYTLLRSRTS